MLDKSIRRSVRPYLNGSETLLGAVLAQNAAAMVYAPTIGDVEGIDVAPGGLAKTVTLRVGSAATGVAAADRRRARR